MFLHRGIKDGLFKASMGIELGFNLLEEPLLFVFILGFCADVSNFSASGGLVSKVLKHPWVPPGRIREQSLRHNCELSTSRLWMIVVEGARLL